MNPIAVQLKSRSKFLRYVLRMKIEHLLGEVYMGEQGQKTLFSTRKMHGVHNTEDKQGAARDRWEWQGSCLCP